jgi:hypothetical protein
VGDVKALAPLVQLTYLDLFSQTKVTGRAAALTPLTRLRVLQLSGTEVTGCAAFCAPGGPFHTHWVCDKYWGCDEPQDRAECRCDQ